jgi:predicted peroxiredoxin
VEEKMPDSENEKIVVIVTHGPAVYLSKKSCYEHVFAPGLPALKELIETYLDLGGKMLICQPCIKERNIKDDMLIKTAEVTSTGRVIQEILEAKSVLNY